MSEFKNLKEKLIITPNWNKIGEILIENVKIDESTKEIILLKSSLDMSNKDRILLYLTALRVAKLMDIIKDDFSTVEEVSDKCKISKSMTGARLSEFSKEKILETIRDKKNVKYRIKDFGIKLFEEKYGG